MNKTNYSSSSEIMSSTVTDLQSTRHQPAKDIRTQTDVFTLQDQN